MGVTQTPMRGMAIKNKLRKQVSCISLAVLCSLFWGVGTLSAQDRATGGGSVVLLGAEASKRLVRGKLDGCEITYRVAFEDHVYRQGGVGVLRGSLALLGMVEEPSKTPLIILKVTIFDIHGKTPELTSLDYVYLSDAAQSYAGKEVGKFPAEDGGLMVAYDMLKYSDLAIALDGPLVINITRKGGGTDIAIPINLQRDKIEVANKHSQCLVQFLQSLQEKFQE